MCVFLSTYSKKLKCGIPNFIGIVKNLLFYELPHKKCYRETD